MLSGQGRAATSTTGLTARTSPARFAPPEGKPVGRQERRRRARVSSSVPDRPDDDGTPTQPIVSRTGPGAESVSSKNPRWDERMPAKATALAAAMRAKGKGSGKRYAKRRCKANPVGPKSAQLRLFSGHFATCQHTPMRHAGVLAGCNLYKHRCMPAAGAVRDVRWQPFDSMTASPTAVIRACRRRPPLAAIAVKVCKIGKAFL